MPAEPEQNVAIDSTPDEKQLCVGCMFPNEASANFCAKCGAPISSYAATGPFESIFAEGHIYRQAVEKPRSFIVVLGIWMIFGMMALAGALFLVAGREATVMGVILGAALLAVALVMIWKTTRSYCNRPKIEKPAGEQV